MHTPKKRFEEPQSDGGSLSPAKTIYVFRCGESGLYAFTTDPKGRVLPSRIYPRVHWRFERRLTERLGRKSPKENAMRLTLDAIVEHGFQLSHVAVNAELMAITKERLECDVIPQDDMPTS